MKTAISISDNLFNYAEQLAGRLGQSRSQLYSNAVAEYIGKHSHDSITEKLNEVYIRKDLSLDKDLFAMQASSLNKEEW